MTKGSIDPLDQIQARNVTKDLFVRNRKKATALFFNMERWRVGCSPDGETCRSFATGKSADGQNGGKREDASERLVEMIKEISENATQRRRQDEARESEKKNRKEKKKRRRKDSRRWRSPD